MTEKEFKTTINKLELPLAKKNDIKNNAVAFSDLLKENLMSTFDVEAIDVIGSFAANTFTLQDMQIDLAIYIKNESNNIRKRIILNALENAVYFSCKDKLLTLERDQNQKATIVVNNDGFSYKIYLAETEREHTYLKSWSNLVEIINQKYTLFRNAIKLIKYYINEEDLKAIDENIIIVILAYALDRYQTGGKYYQYLESFAKGLDDFANRKRIVLLNEYLVLNKEELKSSESSKYEVLSPLDNSINLASQVNDLNIQDYRKLRKKLLKEIEKENEEDYTFDNSVEVVIDIEPVLTNENKYMWHYEVLGKGLSNNGDMYDNTYENYLTALLKGSFKGLKTIIDKGLVKKKIYLSSKYGNVFNQEILVNDENKSRMKTIKNLIEQNKLNVLTIKKQ